MLTQGVILGMDATVPFEVNNTQVEYTLNSVISTSIISLTL